MTELKSSNCLIIKQIQDQINILSFKRWWEQSLMRERWSKLDSVFYFWQIQILNNSKFSRKRRIEAFKGRYNKFLTFFIEPIIIVPNAWTESKRKNNFSRLSKGFVMKCFNFPPHIVSNMFLFTLLLSEIRDKTRKPIWWRTFRTFWVYCNKFWPVKHLTGKRATTS